MLNLIRSSDVSSEVLLSGPHLLLRDLVNLEAGDVLSFEFPTARPLDLTLNGRIKYLGEIVDAGRRTAFRVTERVKEQAS
jgi:flagellar motor switch protein FliM